MPEGSMTIHLEGLCGVCGCVCICMSRMSNTTVGYSKSGKGPWPIPHVPQANSGLIVT